jgi:hypothetical protein
MDLDELPQIDDDRAVHIMPLFSSSPTAPSYTNRSLRFKTHPRLMAPPPPSPRNKNNTFLSGRLPTPIYPSFPSTPLSVSPYLYTSHSPNRPMPSPIREDIMDSQLSKLSVRDEPMDLDDQMPFSPTDSEISFGVARKGRARSGAITTSSRKIFAGYLQNCDKCRDKVPGHYIHFVDA